MKSEMSNYFRLLAGYRLPARKHVGILTHFRTKINRKRPKKVLYKHINSAVLQAAEDPLRVKAV